VNIKNIHNIIFASSYKAKTKVIQAIGRGLRTHDTKDHVSIYDLIDVLKYNDCGKVYENFTIKHYRERLRYYKEEEYFDREVKKIKI